MQRWTVIDNSNDNKFFSSIFVPPECIIIDNFIKYDSTSLSEIISNSKKSSTSNTFSDDGSLLQGELICCEYSFHGHK